MYEDPFPLIIRNVSLFAASHCVCGEECLFPFAILRLQLLSNVQEETALVPPSTPQCSQKNPLLSPIDFPNPHTYHEPSQDIVWVGCAVLMSRLCVVLLVWLMFHFLATLCRHRPLQRTVTHPRFSRSWR